MSRLLRLALAVVLLILAEVAWCGEYVNPNASKVRAKENEWVMIERHYDAEMTPEEFYSDKSIAKRHREDAIKTSRSPNFHFLIVKALFLKPCDATTLDKMLEKEAPDTPEWKRNVASLFVTLKSTGIVQGGKPGKEVEAEKIVKEMVNKNPRLEGLIEQYAWDPLYDCSYRLRINVEYFDMLGEKMKGDSKFPAARLEEGGKRKMSVFPGDTANLVFTIPGGAVINQSIIYIAL